MRVHTGEPLLNKQTTTKTIFKRLFFPVLSFLPLFLLPVDHSKLFHLYPALEETCAEFGLAYKFESQWKMLVGMHQQLAREQPNTFEDREGLRATAAAAAAQMPKME